MASINNILIRVQTQNRESFDRINDQLTTMERRTRRATRSLGQMQATLSLLGGATMFAVGQAVVRTAAEFQGLVVRLTNVEGGIKEAREQMAILNKEFGASSFSIASVADGFTRLRAAGFATEEANTLIKQGAEAVAAFGGNTNELNRLLIGMTQAVGKGTLSMEEMRQQIGEAVPSAMILLADAYNVSVGEMFRMIESGAVQSREAMIKLGDQFQENFGGSIEAQAQTVGGAMNAFSNAIQKATGDMVTFNTSAGGLFVELLQKMSARIVEMINSIDEGVVISFFGAINGLVDALDLAIRAIGPFIEGALGIASTIGTVISLINDLSKWLQIAVGNVNELLGRLGGAALSMGLIGYFLFGRSVPGFIIGAILGVLDAGARSIGLYGHKVNDVVKNIKETQREALQETSQLVTTTVVKTVEKIEKLANQARETSIGFGSNTAEKLSRKYNELNKQFQAFNETLWKQERIRGTLNEKQLKDLERAKKTAKDMAMQLNLISKTIDDKVNEGVAKFARTTEQSANRTEASVKRLIASVSNDPIEQKTLALQARTQGLSAALDKLKSKYEALGDEQGLARVAELQKQIEAAEARGVSNIQQKIGLQNNLNASKERTLQLSLQTQMAELARSRQGGLAQSFSSEFTLQAEDRRAQLKQGIARTQEQIAEKQKEYATASGEARQEIGTSLSLLQQFAQQQQVALEETTAAGLLAQSTWKAVGDAIQGSLKSALRDLIKGTFDAEKALLAFYDKITDAAIDYLFELIKIQFRQQIIASLAPLTGGGAGGGLFSMFLGGFAKGGAFRGGVTPFAEGGVVRGPTMFGLAGEEGDEAILPLERIGGKLGVNAVGGDGGSYTININAIDTQSGAQFLQRNMNQIISQMRAADRLNRGYGNLR